MPQFNTFDLGRVLQTAEAIKGMRREEENDRLRNAYMGEQIQHMQGTRQLTQQKQQAELGQQQAKQAYLVADAVLKSPDPVAAVRQYAPNMIADYEAKNGQGSFERLGPEGIRNELTQVRNFLGAQAGVQEDAEAFGQPQEVVLDGQPAVVQVGNRGTIKRMEGATPYNKPKGSGISFTSPDGTTVQIGGDGVPNYGGVGLTKPNANKLQEVFFNAQGNAYALREQLAKWNPAFSTYAGQGKAAVASTKEKLGMENAPQQTQFLNDYSSWRSDTARLLSQYLNQLSGAAISPHEETRLKAGFPNEDDGPTQYKAKADATMRNFALVQARAAYLLSNPSQSMDSVSLDRMSGILLGEANRLAAALEQGGMEAEAAKAKAMADTRARFGLDNAQ